MPSSQPRIVSLIASATEIVHALGAFDALVGRSHECDFPPSVVHVPPLTRPRFKVDASSREVDRSVKALIEQGLAVYEVDAAALRSVAPDVILTQDQCEVCAVSLRDVEAAVSDWTGHAARIVSLRPHSLQDVYADIGRVGEAIGGEAAARSLVGRMQDRIAAVTARLAAESPVRVAFIEWIDPLMSGGHWLPELVAAARGVSVIGAAGAPSPWTSIEEVAAADPDVILVAPCGYDLTKIRSEMAVLDRDPGWRSLRAVANGRVHLADGNAYFNRPGPRLADTVEIIAEVLHPGVVEFGHLGQGHARHQPVPA